MVTSSRSPDVSDAVSGAREPRRRARGGGAPKFPSTAPATGHFTCRLHPGESGSGDVFSRAAVSGRYRERRSGSGGVVGNPRVCKSPECSARPLTCHGQPRTPPAAGEGPAPVQPQQSCPLWTCRGRGGRPGARGPRQPRPARRSAGCWSGVGSPPPGPRVGQPAHDEAQPPHMAEVGDPCVYMRPARACSG